jgi:DNA processing protein
MPFIAQNGKKFSATSFIHSYYLFTILVINTSGNSKNSHYLIMAKFKDINTEPDAYLALSWISDICDLETSNLIAKFGAIETLNVISQSSPRNAVEKRRKNRLSNLGEIQELKYVLRRNLINYISAIDANWPKSLNDLGFNKPLGLFYKGDIDLLNQENISIIGTRKSSNYGNSIAGEFAFDLASIGFNIVSGGAIGIDTASHHGTLNAQGKTICVQANGLHKFYPSKNEILFEKIIKNGLMISEYPPGRNPTKNYFLDRNRIIAALSKSTMVVEAAEISGALSTVRHALRMQRLVLAVPGSIHSKSSVGTNELIRNREAESVTNLQQVLELILPLGQIPMKASL